MANSKLLKEAIADAKAVRETAIANAKLALEEAFTPRLQSILSKKLQAEMEQGDDDDVMDEMDSSEIGSGDNEPSSVSSGAHTELGDDTEVETSPIGSEEEFDVVDTLDETEDGVFPDPTNADDAELTLDEDDMLDDDDLDLEEIIRELEMDIEDDSEMITYEDYDSDDEEIDLDIEDDEEIDLDMQEDEEIDLEIEDDEIEMSENDDMEFDDEIDLDEILREMGYGDADDEEVSEMEAYEDETSELEAELEEAYRTIKSLRGTINEVNLLNAKLLYTNKLFRSYDLTNEQKTKVVENLDRTGTVREVKLVYATLAESMKFTGTNRKPKRSITEGVSSKKVNSTASKNNIISESTDNMANRFKKLAGII